MAFQPLSVGDILMLSQTAWKIGRAFTHGKKSAPTEFARVEQEANGLSNVLKLAADTLHADDSILSRADEPTVQAVWGILESAERSLNDLESFVERYQIIKRRETSGGYIVERSWSDAVLANYKTLKWTTEGGNIQQLQDMLQMHTNTITLTMQALQTRSLSRLERTVMPMAEDVARIHERVHGDLGNKIDDVHRVIMAVANSTPSLQARDRPIDYSDHRRQLSSGTVPEAPFMLDSSSALELSPQARRSKETMGSRCDSAIATPNSPKGRQSLVPPPLNFDRSRERAEGRESSTAASSIIDFEAENDQRAPAREGAENRASMSVYTNSRPSSLADSPTSTRRGSLTTINEYRALAAPPWSGKNNEAHRTNRQGSSHKVHARNGADEQYTSPGRKTSAERSTRAGAPADRLHLPPPARSPERPANVTPATPLSLLSSNTTAVQDHAQPTSSPKSTPMPTPDSTHANIPFERNLFRNAAILCDTRGTVVEYTKHNLEASDPRYDTEMKALCAEARVCVIRKRENREHGGTRLATSIWVLSDDGSVRCQQKLSEREETVPYCSFFTPEKVSLAGATEDALTLRCHGANWSEVLEKEIKTGWVNYVFASAFDAGQFQSAVFGRTLVASFRTSKTTVIHDGIKGVFAIEEQFAKMDRLRLFEDDGVATPGAEGGVLALLHVSSTFGEGWAKFWLNSSRQQVYVKKDGERCAKIKGLDLAVPGTIPVTTGPGRRPSVLDEHVVRVDSARTPLKRVAGIRVEFETMRERDEFLGVLRRVQEKMLGLPDL